MLQFCAFVRVRECVGVGESECVCVSMCGCMRMRVSLVCVFMQARTGG